MAAVPVSQEQVAEELPEQPQIPPQNLDHTEAQPEPVVTNDNGGDPDAQATVITSLRSQIQDLFSQVTQLNSKLVQSYDRVADLEDNLHVASSNIRQSSVKISQLELERTQHLAALNTGLLVEKSHVTAELTRLMEKATEEAAQRGQAETARADIEKDLDDLSATLFDQANTMVAEARFARAQSERKVEDAERALKGAEEAVGIMQQQMQDMQAEKEKSERSVEEMCALMGKGKWVDRASPNGILSPVVRLRSSHAPYQEFLLFVAHLRTIRSSSSNPPVISTLLPLPFLARLLCEDSDPTVRLDLAPSLNWLSRRSVLSAINAGQLTIEPMSFTNLLQESSSTSSLSSPIISSANSSNANISCALCGASVFEADTSHTHTRPPSHPLRTNLGLNTNSWSTNIFKNPRSYSATNSANNSPPASPNRAAHPLPNANVTAPQQVYIFRLAPTSSTSNLSVAKVAIPMASSYSGPSSSQPPPHPSAHPSTQSTQGRNSQSTIYPLCTSGWCLARLRSTCSLWAFVRTGVIEKIWEEGVSMPPAPPPKSGAAMKSSKSDSAGLSKPPLPPRRRGLWGMASVLGERAASWSEGDKGRTPDKEVDKKLSSPSPPPASAAAKPPPLPKRAAGRSRSTAPSRAASPAPPVEEPKPTVNGHTEDTEHVAVEKSEVLARLDSAETVFCSADAHETKPESAANPIPSEAEAETKRSSPSADKAAPEMNTASPLSSPIDRRISQDSFASAASEIAPSEADSTPDPTPIEDKPSAAHQPGSPNLPSTYNPPHTPTKANNGAAGSFPVSLSPVKQEDPPRTASPAPPPLPRRAAGRPRPSSVIHLIPPVISTTAVSNETKDGTNAEIQPHGERTTATKEQAVDPSAPANEPTKETTDLSHEPASESPTNTASFEGERELAGSPTTVHAVDSMDDAETRKVSALPVPADEAEKTPETSSQTPTINGDHVNGIVAHPSNAQTSKIDEGADGEVYIGDATWEEKTWKELVRLKEEMFWARIGGLR